jgi:hypothetical protein
MRLAAILLAKSDEAHGVRTAAPPKRYCPDWKTIQTSNVGPGIAAKDNLSETDFGNHRKGV